ncbi:hypothetical protein SK128_028285 [Halocaridina rubra]|uniref:Uncharacterized protein n=1 Tax=Halocaridina rubra TaxID=373956 RepID=A0AAN8ZYY3_HALRR
MPDDELEHSSPSTVFGSHHPDFLSGFTPQDFHSFACASKAAGTDEVPYGGGQCPVVAGSALWWRAQHQRIAPTYSLRVVRGD